MNNTEWLLSEIDLLEESQQEVVVDGLLLMEETESSMEEFLTNARNHCQTSTIECPRKRFLDSMLAPVLIWSINKTMTKETP